MKRTKLDAIFSDLVRERANWTCERCGKYFPEGSRMGLHCSHNYSRRHAVTRTHPDNSTALCYACHSWYGSNPAQSGKWVIGHIGQDRIDILERLLERPVKLTKQDKEEAYSFYKKEKERMKKERMSGNTGRLEFKWWKDAT